MCAESYPLWRSSWAGFSRMPTSDEQAASPRLALNDCQLARLAWRAKRYGEYPTQGHGQQHGEDHLGCPRRKHEFEQRCRVTQSPLKRPEGTVPSTNDHPDTLQQQNDQRRSKQPIAASRERARPDITQAAEFDHSY
jgi:hypothetical protein